MNGDERKAAKSRAMRQVLAVQAILRRWDPLGVAPGELSPADEYDSYAPHIVSLVVHGASVERLREHLLQLRTEMFGLEHDAERDGEFARAIVDAVLSEGH